MKRSFIVSCPSAGALGGPSWCVWALDQGGPPPVVHEELQQQGKAAAVSLAPGMGMGI